MQFAVKPIIERKPANTSVLHENPLLSRVLQNRGVDSMEDVTYRMKDLIDPSLMKGMGQACELLERHLNAQSRIVIIGDFDCDGATSTSIAVEGLKMLGFEDVNFLIPDRVIHGYGLTPSIVALAGEMEPDLIVTVDNGIASIEGAMAVKELSHPCELLITDHHLPSDRGEPEAEGIVNPNQLGCGFPSKALAGCGVMFYVIMALRAHLRETGYYQARGKVLPNILPLIDLVALGTVADVVPLDHNNRVLVDAGLRWIKAGNARPGIQAILDIANKDYEKIVATDFGFAVGPRINAAGRLEDMTIGINCLIAKDYDSAIELARRLDELNQQRRDIEADHVFDAAEIIEKHKLYDRKGVVIHDHSWHPGVVGIVASRVKERINRPIICMTDTPAALEARMKLQEAISAGDKAEIARCEQELGECEVKGSARSIDGVHLKHVLDHIYKKNEGILTKFGGHAMAAGLSLKQKNFEKFVRLFDEEIAGCVTDEQLLGNVEVDLKNVSGQFIDIELPRAIRSLGPWGQHFPEPIFHSRFTVLNTRVLKEKHLKMVVSFEDDPSQKFDAICFNCVENGELPVGETFEAAFIVDINEFPKGKENLQLMIRFMQDPDLIKQKAMHYGQEVIDLPSQAPEKPVEREASKVEDKSPEPTKEAAPAAKPKAEKKEDMSAAVADLKSVNATDVASSKTNGARKMVENTGAQGMREDMNKMVDLLLAKRRQREANTVSNEP